MEGRLDGCPGRVLNIALVMDDIQTSYLVYIYTFYQLQSVV